MKENPVAKNILRELSGKDGKEAFTYLLAKVGGKISSSDFNRAKKEAMLLLRNDLVKDPNILVKYAGVKWALDERIVVVTVLICLTAAILTDTNDVKNIQYRDLMRLVNAVATPENAPQNKNIGV